jgi:uncharacterized protein (DUF2062 family)
MQTEENGDVKLTKPALIGLNIGSFVLGFFIGLLIYWRINKYRSGRPKRGTQKGRTSQDIMYTGF